MNPFSFPGALIIKSDGTSFHRNPEALCIFTDNVGAGYSGGTKETDTSVKRRWDEALKTTDLEKKFVMERVDRNINFGDDKLLSDMYDAWKKIGELCTQRHMDHASCSIVELERWAQLVKLDGVDSLRDNLRTTIINKLSNEDAEQDSIFDTITKTCRILAA